MDNLFEIVVILLILLAPALEALFRKGKGKGKGGPGGSEKPGGRRPSGREGGRGRPGTAEERGTAADELIPDDLWELVTGERRARKERQEPWRGHPRRDEGASPPRALDAGAPEAADSEAGEGVWVTEPPLEVEAEAPEPVARYGARAEAETKEERARRLALREAGPMGARRSALLAGARPGALARRGRPPAKAGSAHPLLGEVDRRGLRRAVLWREILGPPVSLRDDS